MSDFYFISCIDWFSFLSYLSYEHSSFLMRFYLSFFVIEDNIITLEWDNPYNQIFKKVFGNKFIEEFLFLFTVVGCTPLHWAVLRGNVEACNVLVHSGTKQELAVKDKTGCTPAKIASDKGYRQIALLLVRQFYCYLSTNIFTHILAIKLEKWRFLWNVIVQKRPIFSSSVVSLNFFLLLTHSFH